MDKLQFNKLTIDIADITSNNLTVGEFLFGLLYLSGYYIEDLEEVMLDSGSSKFELGRVVPSKETISKIREVVSKQEEQKMSDEDMLTLAKKLKGMFPKGIMTDGIPWTEGPILIVQRLEGFFKRFGNYSAEEIEDAMMRYVTAKRGNPYMKSLKNAIYKEIPKEDGTIELQSDLYNYLENIIDSDVPYDIDWTQELRE